MGSEIKVDQVGNLVFPDSAADWNSDQRRIWKQTQKSFWKKEKGLQNQ